MSAKTEEKEVVARVYETGYLIVPNVKEEDVESVVAAIRSEIEKRGGSFVAEGAPSLQKLAYEMEKREGEKYARYDRGYFGWLKFEGTAESALELEASLKTNPSILRAIVFRTVREDTRAKFKAPQLREVKRTDTIKSSPRREEGTDKAPVSEADLDKALETLTTE